MDIEFHYYIVYTLAKKGGFDDEESHIIAYSSQYVDDNCIIYTLNEEESEPYVNYISQTMNILKPKKKLMRIYPCFHFVPGEFACNSAKRKDGKMHILNTTPNSANANVLMDEALSTGDIYRIGIATHSYADTWAHQNFAGYFDYFNGMGGLLEQLTPNIGHADAQHDPDIPGLVWEDKRLITKNTTVNNKERFIEGAGHIFRKFRRHNDNSVQNDEIETEWMELKTGLEEVIGKEFVRKDKGRKERLARYRTMLEALVADFKDYDEDAWFKDAVDVDVKGLPDSREGSLLNAIKMFPDKYYRKDGFEDSDWYKFQEAVMEHQELAMNILDGLFKQMEVEEL
jgi:uncharacterized protein DUF6765